MKRLVLGALALALTTTAAGAPAFAQPGPDRRDIRQDHQEIRQDRRDLRQDQRRADRHWARGQRLDNRYGGYAVVNDWRGHRLNAPPRGYHWVRQNNDYVLAAVATGLIASVIANANY